MRYLSPTDRRLRWSRWSQWTLIVLSGFLVATLLDLPVQHWLPERTGEEAAYYPRLEEKGWYQVLRSMGHLLTWLLICAAILLHDRERANRLDRGVRVIAAPILAGLVAEILKLLLRRERPAASEMLYSFKPLSELLSSSNVGLPSSHTAVAVAGATTLAILMPWSGPVVMLAALGCGLTRIVIGAHHVSDVYVGIVAGVLVGRWVCRVGRRRSGLDILP